MSSYLQLRDAHQPVLPEVEEPVRTVGVVEGSEGDDVPVDRHGMESRLATLNEHHRRIGATYDKSV